MTFSKPAAAPIAIATIFPTLSIIAVVGRFWARRRRKIPYKADDWMVIAALVSFKDLCSNETRLTDGV